MAQKMKFGRKPEAVEEVLENEIECEKRNKKVEEEEFCKEFFSEE